MLKITYLLIALLITGCNQGKHVQERTQNQDVTASHSLINKNHKHNSEAGADIKELSSPESTPSNKHYSSSINAGAMISLQTFTVGANGIRL